MKKSINLDQALDENQSQIENVEKEREDLIQMNKNLQNQVCKKISPKFR